MTAVALLAAAGQDEDDHRSALGPRAGPDAVRERLFYTLRA
ncbi:hypothetical protein [Streptomyces californicus]